MKPTSLTKMLFILFAAAVAVTCKKDDTIPSITFDDGSTVPSPVFDKSSGSQTISFTSSLDWTATSSAGWLTVDRSSGAAGKNSITLTVTQNDSLSQRTARITMISKSLSTTLNKTFTVTQKQKDAIITSTTAESISWNGGDIKITVSANVGYSAVTDAEWISESTATKALEEKEVVFGVDPNWTKDARKATITFTSDEGDLETRVEVTQEANPDPGSGEETPFTLNCTEIGAYNGTDSDFPECTTYYELFQYSFGSTPDNHYFRFVDFSKGLLTILSLESASLSIGSRYTLVTSCSDNGNMVEKGSEILTIVSRKSGKLWLEDKTARTGYIIPTE